MVDKSRMMKFRDVKAKVKNIFNELPDCDPGSHYLTIAHKMYNAISIRTEAIFPDSISKSSTYNWMKNSV